MQYLQRVGESLALGLVALMVFGGCEPSAESDLLESIAVSFDLPDVPFNPPERLRRPVALAVVDSGSQLLVGNSRSGSVSVVDTDTRQVIAEFDVGRSVSDLVPVPQTDVVLVADDKANELLAVRGAAGGFETVGRVAVGASPASVVVAPAGTTAFVASTWARRITVVDLRSPDRLRVESTIDLPFSPRHQQLLPDGRHLVALGAFGGQIGLVDIEQNRLLKTREWKAAHNLRGVALSADQRSLLVPHQLLMSDYATTYNGVHWGAVLMNILRVESIAALFEDSPKGTGSRVYLGEQDDAAGDPTGVAVTRSGQRILAFAGTSEVAISGPDGKDFIRVAVGRRPTALTLGPEQEFAYVANTFGESVSVLDVGMATVLAEIPLGPQPSLSLADEGEQLFYDAHLSSDRWFSCHSCHTDGHSNGLLSDNFGDGSEGSAKRVLSLLGVADTGPWAWNGQKDELAAQVRASILTTMRGPEPREEDVAALTAYLRTLQPPPSLAAARGNRDLKAVSRGADVFERSGCADCHPAPNYTTTDVYDVGVHDALGNSEFNPPSLRGVSQRNRLLHDNRARHLEELFRKHQHGLDEPLEDQALLSLVAFLESL